MNTATAPQHWALPDARTLLRHDVERGQWLTARQAGIGGSEIGVLMGLSNWQTRFGLWQIKTGQDTDTRANALMERGTDLEPIILLKFTRHTGLEVRRQGLIQSKRNPRMLFSPDALSADGRTVEAKLVSQWARDRWTDPATRQRIVPAQYQWQVRHGLATTGKDVGWLAALDADSWELEVFEVEAEHDDFEVISEVVDEFWHYVETGTPPPIDYASATPEEMLSRYRDIIHPDQMVEAVLPEQVQADVARLGEIRAMASASRAAEREEREIKTRITMQIGDKEYLAVQGRPVVRWKAVKQTTFRKKDLEAVQPALVAEFTDRTTTRRLEIVKGDAA